MMASLTSGAALYPLPRFERQAVANCIGFGSKNSALVVKKFEV